MERKHFLFFFPSTLLPLLPSQGGRDEGVGGGKTYYRFVFKITLLCCRQMQAWLANASLGFGNIAYINELKININKTDTHKTQIYTQFRLCGSIQH